MRMLEWIVLGSWLLSLVWTILNLLLIRRIGRREAPGTGPFVSVVIPARNEEATIGPTMSALLGQTYDNFEIIVVDDCSSDGTRAAVEQFARDDTRVILMSGEETPEGWLGKPWALDQGARRARGELLLFVDADITYAPEAIAAAVNDLEIDRADMIALVPNLEMHGLWENAAIPQLTMLGFSLLPAWLGNLVQIPLLAIGGGPGNLIRRPVYDAIGGHAVLRGAVVDDVALARLVRSGGYRSVVVRADDLISVRMYDGLRQIVSGFTKNTFSTMDRNYVLGVGALASSVVFDLLPYALALTGDRLALLTVGVLTATRLLLFRSFGYPLWSALLLQPVQALTWAWIMARSMWVTGIRGDLSWRGRRYDAAQTRFGK